MIINLRFQIKYYLCKIHLKLQRSFKYLLAIFCLISLRFQQPSNFDASSKIKATYIYTFTRYFEWPDKKKVDNFVIYVVGKNDNLVKFLKELAETKKVGTQTIEIKNSQTFDSKITSNIIYFCPEASKPVSDAASKNKDKGTLVIAEAPGACKSGASLNFIVADNRVKFEYKKSSAVKAGLKTNDDLKPLAAAYFD